MCKMDSSFQGTNHIRKIVLQICSVRTRTECHTIVRVVYHFHHTQNVLLVDDDTRQSEYAPCRIIRVDCHVDVIFVTNRHNSLQEIFQVFKQFLIIDFFVHLKQFFDMLHSFRLPSRHHRSVHIPCDRIKHFFRIQCIYCFLCISKYSRTIRTHSCQLCSCPVKYRHEIIAYQVNIFFSQIFQCFDVVVDILVSLRCSCFDRIVHIYTFDPCHTQSGCFHFFFHCADTLTAPYFTRRCIIQCCNHTCYSRDLANLLQSHCVKFSSIPSECHFHSYHTFLF